MAILVGLIIGFVLGLTGAGGSVFAVPLLMLGLDLPISEAVGISLGAVAISALVGTLYQIKKGFIVWPAVFVYGSIGSLITPIGHYVSRALPDDILTVCFAIMIVIIALRMWQHATRKPEETYALRASHDKETNAQYDHTAAVSNLTKKQVRVQFSISSAKPLLGGAVATGFLSGLFGVGGGFLIVPLLTFTAKMPIRNAVSTSLAIITIISSSGFIGHVLQTINTGGAFSAKLLFMVATGGLCGMIIGQFSSKTISGPALQKSFAGLLIVTAVVILYSQLSR